MNKLLSMRFMKTGGNDCVQGIETSYMKAYYLIANLALMFSFDTMAQETEKPILAVRKTTSEITIDGVGDEEAWQNAMVTSPFLNKWPTDSGYAEAKTEVK